MTWSWTIWMDQEAKRSMLRHLVACMPNEGGGLFTGDIISHADQSELFCLRQFHPLKNIAKRKDQYTADRFELVKFVLLTLKKPNMLVATVHSHVDTPPYPSLFDKENIFSYDIPHLIVSFSHDLPRIVAYRYKSSGFYKIIEDTTLSKKELRL